MTDDALYFSVEHNPSPVGEWAVREMVSGEKICAGETMEEVTEKLRVILRDPECRKAVRELLKRWGEAECRNCSNAGTAR